MGKDVAPMKRVKVIFLMCFVCAILAACGSAESKSSDGKALLQDCPLIHEGESSGFYLQIPIDEFNALGFDCGDSVDIGFSNGYELEDIPYYSGYYVEPYAPLLVAYQGSDYVKATYNFGDDLWDVAGLKEGDTAAVSLREKGKYLQIQEANDIHYTNERDDYASDEIFANFRNVTAGRIKENVLYRSASPINNKYNRAACTDDLAAKAGIGYIVDLADRDEDIEGYIAADDFDSPFFQKMYREGAVIPLYMSINYLGDDFQKTLVQCLIAMTEHEGPYLVHCNEGKDRTGYVCMVLEALCGADYQEIVDDYMLTYDNYYGITEKTDPDRYNTIKSNNIDVMLQAMVGDEDVDVTSADLSEYAREYLVKIGVEDDVLEELEKVMVGE